ncbi:MAG: polyprenyl synthetase family protein [Phycisphaerae bacterium]|nr:polyprenyl synthetase family protein [Phycisphaerae bacterium]
MSVTTSAGVESLLRSCAQRVDGALAEYLSHAGSAPARLVEAMRYSIDVGGKRLRPALVLLSCGACGGDEDRALPAAAAIECVHTFTLIHDDLPAMDDDDLRRGRPTNHRVFGEALAILAGNGLLALAFEILARCELPHATITRMVAELAGATGREGVIGGQVEDIDGESRPPERERVRRIHEMKTARLIQSACRLGALAANATAAQYAALSEYGREVGLAFQIADDLLDVTASTSAMGKRTGKDAAAGKQTYPGVVGIEASRSAAAEAVDRAKRSLATFGERGSALSDLADFVVARTS